MMKSHHLCIYQLTGSIIECGDNELIAAAPGDIKVLGRTVEVKGLVTSFPGRIDKIPRLHRYSAH
jgi:hypothetical protein